MNELPPTENKEKPSRLVDSSIPSTRNAEGIDYTVSIALPGSIVDGVLLPELKTYVAGQIGRLAAVFCVDEIVVFNEATCANQAQLVSESSKNNSATFLCRVLQYLETPQYLRKLLFPLHPDLKFVGLLNPLDCSHHVKAEDEVCYREGVVLDRPTKNSAGGSSFVECGLKKNVRVDKHIQPGVRVTVKMEPSLKKDPKYYIGKVVSPSIPRQENGKYRGYQVRFAHSLGSVFTESPFEGGYDLTIGTAENGHSVDLVKDLPKFRHLLVVFGSQKGLEYSMECDEDLKIDDVSLLFDHYLNTCPGHGTKSVRPEEAIFITMSTLRPMISRTTSEGACGTSDQ